MTRKTLDEFLEVLKWSTDFGVDTENGRELKKGVIPVFAAGTYNPREMVIVNGERVTLAQYAGRMNIKLLRLADFNEKLRKKGIDKRLTVQKICRFCREEEEIRGTLDRIWSERQSVQELLQEIQYRNRNVYDFERTLTIQHPSSSTIH